jgi:hypothetical protein
MHTCCEEDREDRRDVDVVPRKLAASIVLYVGLGIIIAATVWNHWKAGHP